MNTKDGILRALDGEPLRPPAIFTQSATAEQMQACGSFWPEAHCDPRKMADLALQPSRLYGFATARIPFNINNDAEAFGCTINRGTGIVYPSISSSPYRAADGIPDVPDLMSPEEFLATERISAMAEAARILSKREDLFTACGMNGPLACTNGLLGMENVLMASILDPNLLGRWFDAVVPHLCAYAKEMAELCDCVLFIEGADTDLIPPDSFPDSVGKRMPKLISASKGAFTAVHSCGDTYAVADKLASLGEDILSPEASKDPRRYRELVGNKVRLAGCVHPVQTLLSGSPEDVVREAERSAEAGFDIVTPECGVPPMTSGDNMLALSQYRERIGKEQR